MVAAFKRLVRRLTPAELAARELAEAELALLEAQSGREWAAAMVTYQQGRVTRLRGYLATLPSTSAQQAS